MIMSANNPPDKLPPSPRRKALRPFVAALFALLALLVIILLLLLRPEPSGKISWMTPAQMNFAATGGVLGRVKTRLEWLIHPFRRYIQRKPRAEIMLNATFYSLPADSTNSFDLGAAASINADGKRAWILPDTELPSFRKRLESTRGVTPLSSPRMTTVDGMRSEMSIGNTIPIGGTMSFVGLSIDLFPRISKDNLNLLIAATSTETNSSHPPILRTNLSLACRASVPDAGALVLDAGNSGTNHYWLLLAPSLIDPAGNPIKKR